MSEINLPNEHFSTSDNERSEASWIEQDLDHQVSKFIENFPILKGGETVKIPVFKDTHDGMYKPDNKYNYIYIHEMNLGNEGHQRKVILTSNNDEINEASLWYSPSGKLFKVITRSEDLNADDFSDRLEFSQIAFYINS